jgi:hypothetical protein
MMRESLRSGKMSSKKGIQQMIGTVLIIAAVVVIGVMLFTYIIETSKQVEVKSSGKVNKILDTKFLEIKSAKLEGDKLRLIILNHSDDYVEGDLVIIAMQSGIEFGTYVYRDFNIGGGDIKEIEISDAKFVDKIKDYMKNGDVYLTLSGSSFNSMLVSPTQIKPSIVEENNNRNRKMLFQWILSYNPGDQGCIICIDNNCASSTCTPGKYTLCNAYVNVPEKDTVKYTIKCVDKKGKTQRLTDSEYQKRDPIKGR